jgi:hypothetical protein
MELTTRANDRKSRSRFVLLDGDAWSRIYPIDRRQGDAAGVKHVGGMVRRNVVNDAGLISFISADAELRVRSRVSVCIDREKIYHLMIPMCYSAPCAEST